METPGRQTAQLSPTLVWKTALSQNTGGKSRGAGEIELDEIGLHDHLILVRVGEDTFLAYDSYPVFDEQTLLGQMGLGLQWWWWRDRYGLVDAAPIDILEVTRRDIDVDAPAVGDLELHVYANGQPLELDNLPGIDESPCCTGLRSELSDSPGHALLQLKEKRTAWG
jgi:hypothetical protein